MSASTTGSFAIEQADRLRKRLVLKIARTVKSPGIDEVHDLRVAIRRFAGILAVLKPCFPPGESRRLRRALKRIMSLAGNVRDQDIAQMLVARLLPEEGDSFAIASTEKRQAAARVLVSALGRLESRNLFAVWRSAVLRAEVSDGLSVKPVTKTAAQLLPRLAGETLGLGKHAGHKRSTSDEIHHFRIAAKKLRYALDVFAPLYGGSLNGLMKHLKGVQKLLGEINDCAAFRRSVARKRGMRKILEAIDKRREKKTEEFRQLWKAELAGAPVAHRWAKTLRQTTG